MLKDHLEQLVREGHLKEFVVGPRNQKASKVLDPRGIPSTPFRSDRSHTCYFKGYFNDLEERDTDSGFGRKLLR